jgi:hypothetical protein
MVSPIEALFPGLAGTAYHVTSPRNNDYNCIAWAAGVTDKWWWPGSNPARSYWPAVVARERTQTVFIAAFALLGYALCAHAEVEASHEKIALFADTAGLPTHAARQLPSGRWTSKLGTAEDIEHELRDLEGALYGAVVVIMRRPVPKAQEHDSAS